MDETQAALIAEQMRHANTLLQARVDSLEAELRHYRSLADHRLTALEESSQDHELRLRAAGEGVTQFKLWAGLANGGSSLMALAALIQAFVGR